MKLLNYIKGGVSATVLIIFYWCVLTTNCEYDRSFHGLIKVKIPGLFFHCSPSQKKFLVLSVSWGGYPYEGNGAAYQIVIIAENVEDTIFKLSLFKSEQTFFMD